MGTVHFCALRVTVNDKIYNKTGRRFLLRNSCQTSNFILMALAHAIRA